MSVLNRSHYVHVTRLMLIIGLLVTLAGCSSGKSKVEDQLALVNQNLVGIREALNKGSIRNATIIGRYSALLKTQRPELGPLLSALEKDATPQGPLFQSLEERYKGLKDGSEYYESWTEKLEEATKLTAATQRDAFNDALSDTVNVIADLSEGELARVNAMSRSAEQTLNSAKSYGAR